MHDMSVRWIGPDREEIRASKFRARDEKAPSDGVLRTDDVLEIAVCGLEFFMGDWESMDAYVADVEVEVLYAM